MSSDTQTHWLGIVGGGQLGWMIALEAQRLGIRTLAMDPSENCAARQAATSFIQAPLDDIGAMHRLARQVDTLTVETEHVDYRALEAVAGQTQVHTAAEVLGVVQDRLKQREFLARHDFPQARFFNMEDASEWPDDKGDYIIKSRFGGYDGKGQARTGANGLSGAWQEIESVPAVAESVVEFEREISVVLARDAEGHITIYPIAENRHRNHILHVSIVPARIPDPVAETAEEIATGIATALDYVGVIATEMFVLPDGRVLVNEIAPRVHNSGHYTLGACVTSQFEQHVRAVCGLPLGDPGLLSPCVMLNLLGDLWSAGEPDWSGLLPVDGAKLFLYGKTPPRPGRKMGHALFMAPDEQTALDHAQACFESLAMGAGLAPERL